VVEEVAGLDVKADPLVFTRDYRPDVYSPAGLKWINDNSMSSVLLRHYPELAPALDGVENAFAPWRRVSARAPA
jgi:hypothetical protein